MESSPLARYIPHKSKKRVFPGSSSSCMDPEVVEISPPITRSSKSRSQKQKEVMHHEIIDIDMDEDSVDVMLIDEKVDTKNKGKEALANFSNGHGGAANPISVEGVQFSKKSCDSGLRNSNNLEGFSSDLSYGDDEYLDIYYDDLMYDDDYTTLQAHFDNIDIPPGVEAPIPWLSDSAQNKKLPATASNLSHSNLQPASVGTPSGTYSSPSLWFPEQAQIKKKPSPMRSSRRTQVGALSHSRGVEPSPSWSFPESLQSKKISASSSSAYSSSQTQKDALNLPPGVEHPRFVSKSSHGRKKLPVSFSAAHHNSHKQLGTVKLSPNFEPSSGGYVSSNNLKNQVGNGSLTHSDGVHTFPEGESYVPWVHDPSQINDAAGGSATVPFESTSSREKCGSEKDILNKFQLFKQFDTVQDSSDHHYSRNGSSTKQPSKTWAKKIQEEWRILEKDLPDTIFVRVYESRMDLLRAVIVGADGTPYHDGLFFFDVFFPSNYPNVPPHVYYHSGGLRINPNLYNCGKVCLSLLNTWSGNQNEKWIPGVSTMLQVLVSIQGLILNAKPYFNEPGYARMSGSESGEKSSGQYNENTFILSLKTMVYSMRRPPKYFEDFVVGHFFKRAHDILVACKAYMDGAQVGCLTNGGVQDVDAGDRSCSQYFKQNLSGFIKTLVQAFTQIGVKDCEKFVPPAEKGNRIVPPAAKGNRLLLPPAANAANFYFS
ncbi:probable ubiquitin-conjugating enzyme E2 26 isoform X2 [Cornus florida]|uniref:probable ubiquitin-conjugating enzyme E2 26 isoform X2 n=1 Tax=Cornus florida TaxID=4283 RepID=UPI00289B8378|nr:probable ubiquitin-conjugating enzyme E2 26 isoform X2 [Cornus florida]